MKKLFCVILLLTLLVPIVAFAKNEKQYMFDEADVLTDKQEEKMQTYLSGVAKEYDIDIAVVFTDSLEGKSDVSFADDFYDERFGRDGLLLLYCTDGYSSPYISTSGKCIDVMSDNLSEYSASVTVYLENQDYTQAVTAFADTTSSLMSSYNTKQLFIGIAISIGVGLVVALIVTSGMKKQLDGARHNVRAEEYVKGGSLDVKIARDLYLYSTVTRTPKPRNTSTHSSGSGRTHGGGRI